MGLRWRGHLAAICVNRPCVPTRPRSCSPLAFPHQHPLFPFQSLLLFLTTAQRPASSFLFLPQCSQAPKAPCFSQGPGPCAYSFFSDLRIWLLPLYSQGCQLLRYECLSSKDGNVFFLSGSFHAWKPAAFSLLSSHCPCLSLPSWAVSWEVG